MTVRSGSLNQQGAGARTTAAGGLSTVAERASRCDLRPFRVVARRIRDRSELGPNRLEIVAPRPRFGPSLAVFVVVSRKMCVVGVELTSH